MLVSPLPSARARLIIVAVGQWRITCVCTVYIYRKEKEVQYFFSSKLWT